MTIKNEETKEGREEKRSFDTKEELENLTSNGEKMGDMAYDLFIQAEKDDVLDPVEDDGDTYNGETTNDINA